MSIVYMGDTLNGTVENDVIIGTPGYGPDNLIYGNAGNDLIYGDHADFVITGGASFAAGTVMVSSAYWSLAENIEIADSTMIPLSLRSFAAIYFTLAEQSYSFISQGGDTLEGGAGSDELHGFGGADLLLGRGGNDFLYGGADHDTLHGGVGGDQLRGDDGDDLLFGRNDNDTLSGNGGADRLYGGGQNDRLYGGADDDSLNGGSGDDTLYGGAGSDRLTGNSGSDVFVFEPIVGTDTVTDFDNGVDLILYQGGTFDDLTITVVNGTDVDITSIAGGHMILENVSIALITEGDFSFA